MLLLVLSKIYEPAVIEKTEEDLLNITNFGQKSLEEVTAKLDELGLSLHASADSDPGVA